MAQIFRGTGMAAGIALGQAYIVEPICLELPQYTPHDPEQEVSKFEHCYNAVVLEMEDTLRSARDRLNAHDAEIIDAQLTLLQDEYSVADPIREAIRLGRKNAGQAIEHTMEMIADIFRQAEDEYIRMRVNDVEDIRRRLLIHVLGLKPRDYSVLPENTVLISEELTPSDTIQMDLSHVVGIVTRVGGYYSHVGIITRNLGIPSICGVSVVGQSIKNGDTVIVDGNSGTLMLEPDPEDLAKLEDFRRQKILETERLSSFRFVPSCSQNGDTGMLCANVGSIAEVEAALANGADGIGLMRSEFLYMNQTSLPDEDTQFQIYRRVSELMGTNPVIIRTLDVGGDKYLPALPMEREENPFLGCRAIRLCLSRPELFRIQLRALLRASVYGNLQIMFPMISSLEELRSAKKVLNQVRTELAGEGIPTAPVPVGIMIEVPAAAIMADQLAAEVDFFSIGTNDLTQYVMAAERGNQAVEYLYSTYEPAVLRLIAMIASAAERAGITCGMCGEAAADPNLLPVFWGMGVKELSMSSSVIAGMRERLSLLRTDECQALAARVLSCASRQEVQQQIFSKS